MKYRNPLYPWPLLLFCLMVDCSDPQPQLQAATHPVSPSGNEWMIQLDQYFTKLVDSAGIPGITVAITRNDSIAYAKGFGVSNLSTKQPVKPDHLFHVASVSKPFAATAIVQLVERGKISLDERLITYLPYFKMADVRYKEITIKQMLNHTSGFPDVEDYEWDKPQTDDKAAERYAKSLGDKKLVSAPGTEFHYSNMAFDVLADVISKVSGQTFESFVKENILLPLDMKESSFYQPETKTALRTTPHTGKPPAPSAVYPYNRRHAPSSTLNSSVIELSHWAIANLDSGVYKGKRILQPSSYTVLMTPTFVIDKEKKFSVGLSWFFSSYKGTMVTSHSGSDLGFRSYLTMIPSKKWAIILLTNYDEAPVNAINYRVIDMLLEDASK